MFLKNFLSADRKSKLKVSIVGGSNSVMRKGYAKYLDSLISDITLQNTSLKYYSLGGVPNVFGAIQEDRHSIAITSDIIFFEYCVNDRHAIETNNYSLDLAGKSLEGFIRKVQKSNPYCLVVLLIFGINQDGYYNNPCTLSRLYESIGTYYRLPVINLTKILLTHQDLCFIKSLYADNDDAHYTRPDGVRIVAKTIIEKLENLGVLKSLKSQKNRPRGIVKQPVYEDNFESLSFIDNFGLDKFFTKKPKVSVYQNTVFREKNFTIGQNNALKFLLKGKLVAVYIKSDHNDGFVKIEFDSQQIVTSSYSSWVHKIKPQNVINLITLPARKFRDSVNFAPVSISCCPEYPKDFELDYNKCEPKKLDPRKWKVSIIGIAYIGEIKPFV